MMSRTWFAWMLLSLLAVASGCAMCAGPYDYCAPTFTGQCGEECRPHVRSGSILSGTVEPMASEVYDDLGSGIILSVTDEKLETSGESGQPTPQLAEVQPVESKGWTAQKPSGLLRR